MNAKILIYSDLTSFLVHFLIILTTYIEKNAVNFHSAHIF